MMSKEVSAMPLFLRKGRSRYAVPRGDPAGLEQAGGSAATLVL
jgi:hypothetical protein